jgi:hypothetical protein
MVEMSDSLLETTPAGATTVPAANARPDLAVSMGKALLASAGVAIVLGVSWLWLVRWATRGLPLLPNTR